MSLKQQMCAFGHTVLYPHYLRTYFMDTPAADNVEFYITESTLRESKNGRQDVLREAASNYKQIRRRLINQTNNSINRAKLSLTRYQGKYLFTHIYN